MDVVADLHEHHRSSLTHLGELGASPSVGGRRLRKAVTVSCEGRSGQADVLASSSAAQSGRVQVWRGSLACHGDPYR
jgi:hypothetical protein